MPGLTPAQKSMLEREYEDCLNTHFPERIIRAAIPRIGRWGRNSPTKDSSKMAKMSLR
jgi:hypothetical protein